MSGIFVSYRRDDTSGHAGALARELNKRFGSEHVFMDIEDIHGGQDFSRTLEKALDGCAVLIALIGPHWLDATDAQGRRRLEDPGDFVRVEIATALQRDVWVIPVLTEGTAMPGAERLPDALRALSSRNAMSISNTAWDESVDRLADQIRTAIYSPERASRAGRPLPPASFNPGRLMGGKMAKFTACFLVLGLTFLAVGGYQGLDTRRLLSLAHKAQGRVVENVHDARDDGDYYYPVVQFESEAGQPIRFRSNLGTKPAAYQVGDSVTVLYDPMEPVDARIDSFSTLWGVAIIFSLFGGSFAAIGIGMLLFAVGRRWRWRRLIGNGRPIMTEFHSVEVNTHVKINERHPYRVVSKWRNPISGEIVYFHGNDVWDDPTEQVRYRSITVLVDPNNVSRYVMDQSILPQAKRSGQRAPGRNEMQDSTSAGASQGETKNRMIALLLSYFLGLVGLDRFYLGKWKSGIVKALTIGGLLIWWLVDAALLTIDAMLYSVGRDTGFVKDAKNRDLVHGVSPYRLKNGRIEADWFAAR